MLSNNVSYSFEMTPSVNISCQDEVTGLPIGELDIINNNFTYHPPKPGQPEKYVQLRDKAKELAILIHQLCPSSRERSIAITNLEQAVYWANGSIARNE